MKRKASSPARDAAPADKPPPPTSSPAATGQPPGAGPPRASPRLPHTTHPLASAVTGSNGAYVGSPSLPPEATAAGTGTGTNHTDHASQPSAAAPHATDPTEVLASPYDATSLSLDPDLRGDDATTAYSAQQLASAAQLTAAAAAAQQLSAEQQAAATRLPAGTPSKLSASIHICDCCPKKPKKFDTLEELR